MPTRNMFIIRLVQARAVQDYVFGEHVLVPPKDVSSAFVVLEGMQVHVVVAESQCRPVLIGFAMNGELNPPPLWAVKRLIVLDTSRTR